jgi:hypothetical protein
MYWAGELLYAFQHDSTRDRRVVHKCNVLPRRARHLLVSDAIQHCVDNIYHQQVWQAVRDQFIR